MQHENEKFNLEKKMKIQKCTINIAMAFLFDELYKYAIEKKKNQNKSEFNNFQF